MKPEVSIKQSPEVDITTQTDDDALRRRISFVIASTITIKIFVSFVAVASLLIKVGYSIWLNS